MANQTVKIKTKEGTKGVKVPKESTHTSSSGATHGGSGSKI